METRASADSKTCGCACAQTHIGSYESVHLNFDWYRDAGACAGPRTQQHGQPDAKLRERSSSAWHFISDAVLFLNGD